MARKALLNAAEHYASPQSRPQSAPQRVWPGNELPSHVTNASLPTPDRVSASEILSKRQPRPDGLGRFGPVGPENAVDYFLYLNELLEGGAISHDDMKREIHKHMPSIKRQNLPQTPSRPDLIPQSPFIGPSGTEPPQR